MRGIFTDGDLRRVLSRPPSGDDGGGALPDPSRQPIDDLMTPDPVRIRSGALAAEAVRLMEERRIGQLLVVDDDDRLAGALHFHDLLAAKIV